MKRRLDRPKVVQLGQLKRGTNLALLRTTITIELPKLLDQLKLCRILLILSLTVVILNLHSPFVQATDGVSRPSMTCVTSVNSLDIGARTVHLTGSSHFSTTLKDKAPNDLNPIFNDKYLDCESYFSEWGIENSNDYSIFLEQIKFFENAEHNSTFHGVKARRLAQVVGKIISMSPVIGNVSRLKTRYSYMCIESRVSWDTVLNMEIPVQVKEELLIWLDNIERVNEKKLDFYSKSTVMVYSDASNFACVAYTVEVNTNSLGSESESLLSCSKFHFEEKILEKVVRLEHKMEVYAEKIKLWEESITSILDKVTEAKKKTETFVESMRDAYLQDQTRFNDSFLETVDHFKLQSANETGFYERQMNSLLDSFSSKVIEFSEAERKRESTMKLSLHQEQNRFNESFEKIVGNFQVRFNNSLQEIALKQQKVALTACHAGSTVSSGKIVHFRNIKTNIGITDLSAYKSTGKFVCTVTGLYHVSAVMMSYTEGVFYYIYKNNDNMIETYYGKVDGSYQTRTRVFVTMLDVGDEITVRTGGSQYIYHNSCFTIVKIN
ncbi:C1QL [Mytilus coruscus]|uniref:C1QL n=1 Tax=Mytilus coruscus TaxID=42192 RepID=A0A6J8BL71_MYTCO|nr:C1QL [Mytilus coruscus]